MTLPQLPKIGPVCFADSQSILMYRTPMVGSHLPGVRDVGLWTSDQMREYGAACAAAEREQCAAICDEQAKELMRTAYTCGGDDGVEVAASYAAENCAETIRGKTWPT